MLNRRIVIFLGLGLLLLGSLGMAGTRNVSSLNEVATGDGTFTSDSGDNLRIKAVAVFLKENGKAEICLMTSAENVYAVGRWFHDPTTSRTIRLAITGDNEHGCASGHGTVVLQENCVPIAELHVTMTVEDGTTIEANFFSSRSRPCIVP